MKVTKARRRHHAVLRNPKILRGQSGAVPIMSWTISRGLSNDVGDAAYSAFLDGYVRLRPGRYTRLGAATKDCDGERSLDAALSMRSSSLMLGP